MDETPPTQSTLDLSEAQVAYEMALARLEMVLPTTRPEPVVVDPTAVSLPRAATGALLLLPRLLVQSAIRLVTGIGEQVQTTLQNVKAQLIGFSQGRPAVIGGPYAERRQQIRMRLLEALWARDHVQEAIERHDGANYESKRIVLAYVMANETRLQRLGQMALAAGDLDTASLRETQPTPPSPERWWWFLNYPRAKRARRMNTLWFILALFPALASIVLVTLLAQRLAINGPDLLSGASVIAQVGLGLFSIIAGREVLNDLIIKGATVSWEGKLTFSLTCLFLIVTVLFYFVAPPGAALIYNLFGQQAIRSGNAAEAELYLESAARLDPNPHAASLLEVGCLYQTLGAPDRAQVVFERVLEADSRLLLARFHLAQLYSDRADYVQALQLLEDGLDLLDTGREDLADGTGDFLPNVDTLTETDQLEYLLRLARGRAYLESGAPEQAKANLRDAEDLLARLETETTTGSETTSAEGFNLACGPDDDLGPFILSTQLDLHYNLARTYDALCDDDATVEAAMEEWRLVRNGRPSNSQQEAWRDDAIRRLTSGKTCREEYGLQNILGLSGIPSRR